MSSHLQAFKDLHHSSSPFILPNAWDAGSALRLEQHGYPAIATSSMAVAHSLGYDDGENMPFEHYLFVIKRILSTIRVPLTVDLEMGYGESDAAIYNNIVQLIKLGVAGINIEDSVIDQSQRTLKAAKLFASTIKFVKNKLSADGLHLFVNLRCDTYLLNVEHKQKETRQRLSIYEAAGADGIFLPCIANPDDISEAVNGTSLPLNVMCIPGLPGFDILAKLGVKRISTGGFLFNKVYDQVAGLAHEIELQKNFSPLLS